MSVAQNNAVRTLGQIRAQKAWDTVDKASRLGDEKQREDFGREAKKLPTRIMTAGLGHALAFVKAKGGNGSGKELLYNSVSEMIAERIPPRSDGGKKEPSDLLERIVRGDAVFLRRATAETLEYLQWVARFAEAKGLVGSDDTGGTAS